MLVQVKFSGFSLQHCKLLEQQGRSWNVPIDKLIRNLETWCVVWSDCKILINVKIIVIINEKKFICYPQPAQFVILVISPLHELTDREKSFLKIKYKMTASTISTDQQPSTIESQCKWEIPCSQTKRRGRVPLAQLPAHPQHHVHLQVQILFPNQKNIKINHEYSNRDVVTHTLRQIKTYKEKSF